MKMNKTLFNLFEKIAADKFYIETLETRNSDSLDFHDVAVWQILNALQEAYNAGYQAAENKKS